LASTLKYQSRKEKPTARAEGHEPTGENHLDFNEIYEQEFGYVWKSLQRLGIRGSDLPDLTHEVFLRVFRGLDDYDPLRPLRPWLFGISFRTASEHRRAQYRHREVGEVDQAASDAPSADQVVSAEQDRRLVLKALESLSMERRAVLVLHEIDGLTVPEISQALGVRLNTAYSRLRRGLIDFEKAVRRLRRENHG
jgi:RNA polymerase sigma-70 factor (ECF subfamily)